MGFNRNFASGSKASGGAAIMEEWISAAEAARILSISIASVRNWTKAGRLSGTRIGRRVAYRRAEVEALREALASGRTPRLRSRRNKTAADGAFVPAGYVRTKAYERLARQAVEIAADRLDPRLALLELALKLLVSRGHLAAGELEAGEEASLAERFLAGRLDAGGFAPLLRRLSVSGACSAGASDASSAAGSPPLDAEARRRLRALAQLPAAYVEGDDLLGLVYLSFARLRRRKRIGAYYTPSTIVEALVDDVLDRRPEAAGLPRVLDPCCGSGNILIRVYLALKRRLAARGLTAREADRLLQRRQALAGFDIDETAVLLAQLNLALLAEPDGGMPAAFPIRVQNALHAPDAQPGGHAGPYDVVIGNPPWGYQFEPGEADRYKHRYRTAGSARPESFGLFIEAGLALLDRGGLLAYVLPESLLSVDQHAETRRLIAEQTEMLGIALAGSPFTGVSSPVITLTLRKRPPAAGHAVVVRDGGSRSVIAQRRFRNNPGHAFNVRAADAEQAVLERMRGAPGVWYLRNQCDFALGIVTGDNSAYVREFPDGRVPEGWEPVLRGADVFMYNAHPAGRYIHYVPGQFQQTAPERLYRAPEKLIYRFIHANLVFAYDDRQMLSLNSANIIIPRAPGYAMKYVLAVLNSRPARFYHTYAHASVKVLRRHLESLPIPDCPAAGQRRIIALVDRLIACTGPAERRRLYDEIDRRIMALYGLSGEEQRLIEERCGEPKALNRRR